MSAPQIHPHAGHWTVTDVLALPDDGTGTRYELIQGTLIMSPPPGITHQRLSRRLSRRIEDALPPGLEVLEAVGIEIADDDMIVPDIVVAVPTTDPDTVLLRPDQVSLAIEVVSKGSTRQDRTLKPLTCAEIGIPHFWRIEPRAFRGKLPGEQVPVVFAYSLTDQGGYELVVRAGAGQSVTLPGPIPITLDPATLLP